MEYYLYIIFFIYHKFFYTFILMTIKHLLELSVINNNIHWFFFFYYKIIFFNCYQYRPYHFYGTFIQQYHVELHFPYF